MNSYYKEHKEHCLGRVKNYQKTPIGRATKLLNDYRRSDKTRNRGEGDITAQWIVDNIFSKPCVHCGETDWRKIGCNRLDNSRPHTMDNVEPCCKECNRRLGTPPKPVYQYKLVPKLVKVWNSMAEAGRNGFNEDNIRDCCKGKTKHAYGYKWSYNPL